MQDFALVDWEVGGVVTVSKVDSRANRANLVPEGLDELGRVREAIERPATST